MRQLFIVLIFTFFVPLSYAQNTASLFVIETKKPQTFEAVKEQQLIQYGTQNSSNTFVSYRSDRQTFELKQKGYYEIQTGITLNFNLKQPLPKTSKLWVHLLVLDNDDRVLEAVPYFVARDAVKEPTYVETPNFIVHVERSLTLRVVLEIQSGEKFIGPGPHSTTTPYFPFAKSIKIRKL